MIGIENNDFNVGDYIRCRHVSALKMRTSIPTIVNTSSPARTLSLPRYAGRQTILTSHSATDSHIHRSERKFVKDCEEEDNKSVSEFPTSVMSEIVSSYQDLTNMTRHRELMVRAQISPLTTTAFMDMTCEDVGATSLMDPDRRLPDKDLPDVAPETKFRSSDMLSKQETSAALTWLNTSPTDVRDRLTSRLLNVTDARWKTNILNVLTRH